MNIRKLIRIRVVLFAVCIVGLISAIALLGPSLIGRDGRLPSRKIQLKHSVSWVMLDEKSNAVIAYVKGGRIQVIDLKSFTIARDVEADIAGMHVVDAGYLIVYKSGEIRITDAVFNQLSTFQVGDRQLVSSFLSADSTMLAVITSGYPSDLYIVNIPRQKIEGIIKGNNIESCVFSKSKIACLSLDKGLLEIDASTMRSTVLDPSFPVGWGLMLADADEIGILSTRRQSFWRYKGGHRYATKSVDVQVAAASVSRLYGMCARRKGPGYDLLKFTIDSQPQVLSEAFPEDITCFCVFESQRKVYAVSGSGELREYIDK